MWTRRILTVAVLLGLVGLTTADAQWGGRRGRAGGRMGQFQGAPAGPFAQLELTEDQRAAIQALRQTRLEQMQALREAGILDREAAQAAWEGHRQAVFDLLTPVQQSRLEELRAQAPQRGFFRGRGRRGARGGALLQLGLSEDQQAAIQALRQTQREQMQALCQAGTLDREAVQTAREENHRAVLAILTPEQQTQLEELRAQAPQRGFFRGHGLRGRRGPGAWGPCLLGTDAVDEAGDTTTDEPAASDDLGYRLRLAPNPFNPETHITFELPAAAQVQLEVYDVLGRRVRTLAAESFGAGTHSVVWDGRSDGGQAVAGGAYFARLVANGHQSVQRMMLLK